MSTRQISISTLSPLHIGCDDVFDPSQFVIAEQALHVLDPAVLAAALDDRERQQLMKLAAERDPIGPLQQFFKSRRERLARLSTEIIDVATDIARDYDERAGQIQARGGDGRPVYNLFPMARTAYNPVDGVPYLPGSSIKGSLRTAWLNQLNKGNPPSEDEKRNPGKLQQRLLGYAPGKFENDPFRHVRVADAHANPDRNPPPTRISYAVSKKKRESERGSPELKIFLEAVRESLPSAFVGEIRFTGDAIDWNHLCDACNAFYGPQLAGELDHPQFGALLTPGWRQAVSRLLGSEMQDLMAAHQGFLLRVGRHSGAESVTLDGVRSIKILGAKGQPPSYRSTTTEKRFVSATRAATEHLLPFGWLWIDGCDDAHQHLAIAMAETLSCLSQPIRDAHAQRLARTEERRESQRRAAIAAEERAAVAETNALEVLRAAEARAAALAAMSPNQRLIEEFVSEFRGRHERYPNTREVPNAALHGKARALAKAALEGPDWSLDEKRAAADAIEEWLPKVVKIDIKDERKKLKLAVLRGKV
jgi:CRISPR-associated protein Csm5